MTSVNSEFWLKTRRDFPPHTEIEKIWKVSEVRAETSQRNSGKSLFHATILERGWKVTEMAALESLDFLKEVVKKVDISEKNSLPYVTKFISLF